MDAVENEKDEVREEGQRKERDAVWVLERGLEWKEERKESEWKGCPVCVVGELDWKEGRKVKGGMLCLCVWVGGEGRAEYWRERREEEMWGEGGGAEDWQEGKEEEM